MAEEISKLGHEVLLVYYEKGKVITSLSSLYNWCNCKVTDRIEDKRDNIFIAPESMTYVLFPYKAIKKVIYWLSLDFYFWSTPYKRTLEKMRLYSYPKIVFPFAYIHLWNSCVHKKIVTRDMFKHMFHLYNCEYERQFLSQCGVPDMSMHYLCGPIENSFCTQSKEEIVGSKINAIAYNTNRDKVIMKTLNSVLSTIKSIRSDITLIPIEKMTREEVSNTLMSAKLFLDLGSFPGPERIPREASLAYTNLLISNSGAAKNIVDYPIPDKYKLDKKTDREVAMSAIDMIDSYYKNIEDFSVFRDKVRNQQIRFVTDIAEIFSENTGMINAYCDSQSDS